MRNFLSRLFFVFALFGMTPAFAEGPNECRQILSTPKFKKILQGIDGYRPWQLSSRDDGQELIGKTCLIENLVAYFETDRWKYIGIEEGSVRGPFGGGTSSISILH